MTDSVEKRLEGCFAIVFPRLERNRIRHAETDNVEGWDSVAMVTLAAVIGEEFGLNIPAEDLSDLLTFASFAEYLRSLQL
jgi:acyl carrier protein